MSMIPYNLNIVPLVTHNFELILKSAIFHINAKNYCTKATTVCESGE